MELQLMSHSYRVHEFILWLNPEFLGNSQNTQQLAESTHEDVTAVSVEAPEAPPRSENISSKQYHLPGGITQVGANIKYLTDAEVVVLLFF